MAETSAVKKLSPKVPNKLTGVSMIGYLSEKRGLTRKVVRQLTEDMFDLVATGVMRGERVTLGKMGKIFIRVRPARAARMGRNPLNGQEVKIPAKPATKVPRFTFSKTFKELAKRQR